MLILNLILINLNTQSICDEISVFSQEKRDELHILNDIVTGNVNMECFLYEMDLFYKV